MDKNYWKFVLAKATAYFGLVVPMVAVCWYLFDYFGKSGVLYAVPACMLILHVLLSGESEEQHTYLKQLIMRRRHFR